MALEQRGEHLGHEPALHLEIQKLESMRERLSNVVIQAGESILSYRGPIIDTGTHHGHEQSTIDNHARSVVNNLLDQAFPDIEGIRRFEDRPINIKLLSSHAHDHTDNNAHTSFVFIIDEVDGTTNTKRVLANLKEGETPRPDAATSIAICSDEKLGSLQVSAIYTFDSKDCFSAMRVGNGFIAFRNDRILRQTEYGEALGDSASRIIVAGYSNNNRLEKGKWEDQLYNTAKLRVYEGCRASTIDIIKIIRGEYDAYVDPRALWGKESGAKLQAYDISGAIGIALGAGFEVSDVYGNSWTQYDLNSEIPIVISRSKQLHAKILKVIEPLLSMGSQNEQARLTN